MGLPEEYIELFPVPFIVTRLGKAQSAPFFHRQDFAGSLTDAVLQSRRMSVERRRETLPWNPVLERRLGNDRRYSAAIA